MRKVKLITALSLAALMLVSLSNTVSAEAAIGPPIGGNKVEFVFDDPLEPGDPVEVKITWWIDDNDPCGDGRPFSLHLALKDSDGEEVADWERHKPSINAYSYTFKDDELLYAPSPGAYDLDVQIVAKNDSCNRLVGNSGKTHPFLVASEGGSITSVPEFSTIAIPVAVILGLLFFFNHRKRKKS